MSDKYYSAGYVVSKVITRIAEVATIGTGVVLENEGNEYGALIAVLGLFGGETIYQTIDQMDKNAKFTKLEQSILNTLAQQEKQKPTP